MIVKVEVRGGSGGVGGNEKGKGCPLCSCVLGLLAPGFDGWKGYSD